MADALPTSPGARAWPTESILGFPIATAPLADGVAALLDPPASGASCRYFACANPHSLVVARRDATFAAALRGAEFLVPDGVGILWASRLLGGRIRRRVTGTDLFLALGAELNRRGGTSCFFLGSSPDNLADLAQRYQRDFPGIRVAGVYSPPFRSEFTDADNAAMLAAIEVARPDFLWVGLTAPKQEKWIWQHRHLLPVRWAGPVGGVFDFYTGRVPRASPGWQRLGLEWLPRLCRQPRRLWRRNLDSFVFLALVLSDARNRRLGPRANP